MRVRVVVVCVGGEGIMRSGNRSTGATPSSLASRKPRALSVCIASLSLPFDWSPSAHVAVLVKLNASAVSSRVEGGGDARTHCGATDPARVRQLFEHCVAGRPVVLRVVVSHRDVQSEAVSAGASLVVVCLSGMLVLPSS